MLKHRLKILLGVIVVCTLSYVKGVAQERYTADKVVAVVGNSMVLYSDVEKLSKRFLQQQKESGYTPDQDVRSQALEQLILSKVLYNQALIDSIQYHTPTRGEYLPAASYSLVSQEYGRGVYSFCMCPGGVIVPALTDAAESVVNGMSSSLRNSPFANSGLVTEIRLADFEHLRAEWGELAGLKFQEQFEQLARREGGEHQVAPAQRVADFVAGRSSSGLPRTSFSPGMIPSRLDQWMPEFISEALRAGITTFGRRMKGFVTNEALVAGVESRTSTPVRIPRDANSLMHPQVEALFPTGEGAGYAGGIISAALDGERVADAVANYLKRR